MNKRLSLCLLTGFIFLNPLFFSSAWADSDTFLWIGGFSNRWEDGENWMNLDSMTVGLLPLPVDDVMIDGGVTVTVNSNLVIESVQLSGGATLIIAAGAVVLENMICEANSIYAGVPAKKIKAIPPEMIEGDIQRIANNYVKYADWFREK